MAQKLLLAEDSLTIQKVFSLTFQQSDISLTMVDNGEDAVRLAGEISPDLVVADVTLADKDGFEVATALRSAGATRSCPILILAGSLTPFDEEKFRRCGADDVLFKPFESQELIDKVDAMLRGGEVLATAASGEAEAETAEPWDFSDVLEEVEETGTPAAPAQAASALFPGDDESVARGEDLRSLGEFDVSLEEIATEAEGPESPLEESTEEEEPVIEGEEVAWPTGEAMESIVEERSFLDLQAEELGFEEPPVEEEGQHFAEEILEQDQEFILQETVEHGVEVPLEKLPDHVLEPAPFVPPDPAVAELTAVPDIAVVPGDRDIGEGETGARVFAPGGNGIREEFSEKVREILEKVAAETVEKVMWEMMERLSGEIRQQIREAVETVAWDVIPATAESLILEEIERIRGKAGE